MSQYYCEKCNYRTSHKDYFQKHIKSKKHLSSDIKESKKFQCEQCHFYTNDLNSYNKHLQTKKHISIYNIDNNSVKQDLNTCPCCEYTNNVRSALRFHIIRHHMNINQQKQLFNFWCNCCEMGYISKVKFDTHMASTRHKNNILYRGQANLTEIILNNGHISLEKIISIANNNIENKVCRPCIP